MRVLGLARRRDLRKAERLGLVHHPVEGFLARAVILPPDTPLSQAEARLKEGEAGSWWGGGGGGVAAFGHLHPHGPLPQAARLEAHLGGEDPGGPARGGEAGGPGPEGGLPPGGLPGGGRCGTPCSPARGRTWTWCWSRGCGWGRWPAFFRSASGKLRPPLRLRHRAGAPPLRPFRGPGGKPGGGLPLPRGPAPGAPGPHRQGPGEAGLHGERHGPFPGHPRASGPLRGA